MAVPCEEGAFSEFFYLLGIVATLLILAVGGGIAYLVVSGGELDRQSDRRKLYGGSKISEG